jgi:uncharacterized protein YjiS (DUF1127 family)
MRNALDRVHTLQRKLSFNLWVDRLVFRGDSGNFSDRMLADIGLARRDRPQPSDPIFFI